MINEFYWFHKHPELSFHEFETTRHIRENLEAAGIRILKLPLETGLVAEIGTGQPPFVGVRCDIDALPVTEETELPYRSEHPGCMHACGHDFHIATILGTAFLLQQREQDIHGTIRLIFQPAEEGPSGALKIVQTGIIDDMDTIFGLHCTPLLDVGTLGFAYGPVMAAVDAFAVTFHGKGTHAAHPEKGIDPIVAAAAFVGAVQTVVSRNMDPFAANLISVTHIAGGNNWNVIPESAFLEGTTRTMTAGKRVRIKQRLTDMAQTVAQTYGVSAEVRWTPGPPALDNDADWGEFAKKVAAEQQFGLAAMAPSLGGEDFAFYYEKVKGFFVYVGTGHSYPNHNPKFQVDPAALYPAAGYMSELAVRAVDKLKDTY
ncbi:hydrolase [Megasphaera cerevisiae]|nr:hydrolase [Megasphaera cerevisiae]